MSQSEPSNSSTQFAKKESEAKVPLDRSAKLGRPLFWSGVVRMAFGGILVSMAVIGFILMAGRADALWKAVQGELKTKAPSVTQEKQQGSAHSDKAAETEAKNQIALKAYGLEVERLKVKNVAERKAYETEAKRLMAIYEQEREKFAADKVAYEKGMLAYKAAKMEADAAEILFKARLLFANEKETTLKLCREIIEQYPDTQAAKDAKVFLDGGFEAARKLSPVPDRPKMPVEPRLVLPPSPPELVLPPPPELIPVVYPPPSDPAKDNAKDIGASRNEVNGAAPKQPFASVLEFFLQIPFFLVASIAGCKFLINGLMLVLQPVYFPPDAPGKIKSPPSRNDPRDERGQDLAVLMDALSKEKDNLLYLGTYKIPTSLLSLVLHAMAPSLSFLTPPMHKIIRASTILIIAILVSSLTVLTPWGWGLLLIPASLLPAMLILIVVVLLSSPRRPRSPQIEEYGIRHEKAGSPMDFFHRLAGQKGKVGELAAKVASDGDFRILPLNSDMRGRNAVARQDEADQFDWQISLETEPVLVKDNAQFATAAFVLEAAVVTFGLVGAVFTLMPADVFWGLKLAGSVLLLLAYWFMRLAYTLRNVFRWQSDLFSVVASGTRTRAQKLTGSREVDGLETNLIKSKMVHLIVSGTRVISECADPDVWGEVPKHLDNLKGLGRLQATLLSKRYLIETCVDDKFREKMENVRQMLQSFEDSEEETVRQGEKARRHEAQQQLMLEQQMKMQMMVFGKVLEKMTPEQARQLMASQGGTLPTCQLSQQPVLAALTAQPPDVEQPLKSAPPAPAPQTNRLTPEIEKQLRNAYQAYFRSMIPPCDTASRDSKLDVIKSIIRQSRIPKQQYQAIEKEVRAEFRRSLS